MLSCNTVNYLIKSQSERYVIMLINDDYMITDDKTFATFNEHYINNVERYSSLKPAKMKFEDLLNTSRNILHSMTDRYKNHPSIHKIKSGRSSKSFSDSYFVVIF